MSNKIARGRAARCLIASRRFSLTSVFETPRVPGIHALLDQQRDVLVVRHERLRLLTRLSSCGGTWHSATRGFIGAQGPHGPFFPLCHTSKRWGRALDTEKIDGGVLALLYLTRHDHWRAWKGFDWDALDRLYEKGLIGDPVNKAKSVVFTEEGLKRAEELFQAMFTKPD